MAILEGPVISRPVVYQKQAVGGVPIAHTKVKLLNNGFWGLKGKCSQITRLVASSCGLFDRRRSLIHCSFSSSSDGNGSMAENFNENDEEFINASVTDAVEVRSSSDGFFIKMHNGKNLRCIHNNPQEGNTGDYAPHPAIVLKMEDGSDLLLPIIVLEMPSVLLIAAVRNIQIARPTIYQVVQDMIERMGYEAQLVRVTKRVNEAYFAQLYLAKVGNEKDMMSFDLRPSDAINIAVRCKVPIQVHRDVAFSDGMKVVEPVKIMAQNLPSDGLTFAELDRPSGHPCMDTKEFILVRNMLIAAVEERYKDAAQWRDKLLQFRAKKKNKNKA